MIQGKIKIEEVAVRLNCSIQTINTWYRWKQLNPNSEYASLLPDYIQVGNRQTRYWDIDDLWKFIEFKQKIPKGRNGVMGDITQRRLNNNKKKRRKNDGKKTINSKQTSLGKRTGHSQNRKNRLKRNSRKLY